MRTLLKMLAGFTAVIFMMLPLQATAGIVVSPTSYNFGDVELGSSPSVIFTLTNTDSDPLTIMSVYLEPSSSPDFSITSDPAGTMLMPGESAEVEVTYAPSSPEYALGEMLINYSNGSPGKVHVSLRGGNVEASVRNGGFETGDFTFWNVWENYYAEVTTTTDAQSGLYAAKVSIDHTCGGGSIKQNFVVPSEGIFSFYYKSNVQGTWSLFDIDTGTSITIEGFNYTSEYTLISYDLSAYAGHQVRFIAGVVTSGMCNIPILPPYEMHIDNVSVIFSTISIIDDIEENLVDSGVLNNGQGSALIAKLKAVEMMINKGNTRAACNQLHAFINQLEADINAGILSLEEGQPLIDEANSLIGQFCG